VDSQENTSAEKRSLERLQSRRPQKKKKKKKAPEKKKQLCKISCTVKVIITDGIDIYMITDRV